MLRMRRDPGDGINKRDIYEVWGDMVENAADDGPTVIAVIQEYLETSFLFEYFQCQVLEAKEDGRPFLMLKWNDMMVDIDARPFGAHLDVYAILALKRGLLDSPDPLARIADLEGWQRRDLQVFQTLLKRAIEEALIALDEGWR
jgi:hypothetical protein